MKFDFFSTMDLIENKKKNINNIATIIPKLPIVFPSR